MNPAVNLSRSAGPSLLQQLWRHKVSAILTVLSMILLAYLLFRFLNWAVVDAVLNAKNRAACTQASAAGACWASVAEWSNALLFGFYPADGTWRSGSVVFFALVAILTFVLTRKAQVRLLTLLSMLFLPAIALRLAGGVDGLIVRLPFIAGLAALILGIAHHFWTTAATSPRWRLACAAVALVAAVAVDGMLPALQFVTPHKWGGAALTMGLVVLCVAYGFPLGLLLALARRSKAPWLSMPATALIELVRSLPLVLVLIGFSIVMPRVLPVLGQVDLLLRAAVALVLFSSVYFAEIIRAGLSAVGKGQFEAAAALGLSHWKVLALVAMPQALRIMLPNIVVLIANIVKDTALVSVVGVFDLMNVVRSIGQDPNWLGTLWEPLFVAAVFYFTICFTLSMLATRIGAQRTAHL